MRQGTDYHEQSSGKVGVAEGIEGRIPMKGSVTTEMTEWYCGIQAGFFYCGAINIPEIHRIRKFNVVTSASLIESNAHDIEVTVGGGLVR